MARKRKSTMVLVAEEVIGLLTNDKFEIEVDRGRGRRENLTRLTIKSMPNASYGDYPGFSLTVTLPDEDLAQVMGGELSLGELDYAALFEANREKPQRVEPALVEAGRAVRKFAAGEPPTGKVRTSRAIRQLLGAVEAYDGDARYDPDPAPDPAEVS